MRIFAQSIMDDIVQINLRLWELRSRKTKNVPTVYHRKLIFF